MSEKTEQPTPRRLRRAREQGDSPISAGLLRAVGFLAVAGLAPATLEAAADRASTLLRAALEDPERSWSAPQIATEVVALTAPLVAVAALATAVAGLIQTGGVVAFRRVAPDLNRANPFEGLRRLVTWQRAASVGQALVAAVAVAWVAIVLVLDHGTDFAAAVGRPAAAIAVAAALAARLVWWAAAIGVALAIVDVAVSRYSWLKRLRMTKDEIKREHKEAEGDPEVKAARRRAYQEAMRGATLAAVKNATVLIVNPTHLAIALEYAGDEESAPVVIAQGDGSLARQMIDAARAYGVPVVRDVPVARALSELEVGDEIPEALYEAVAEILRDIWEHEEGTREPAPGA